MDAAVPVTAVGLLEHVGHGLFQPGVRVRPVEPGLVIEERRPGQARDLQQYRKRIVRLEGDDDLGFYPRPCSFKARSFFR